MASQALQVVDAEVLGCVRRLADAHRLHAAERRCGLATAPGSLAALAVGEADDSYLQVPVGMKRDGTIGAPDEIGGEGADDGAGIHWRVLFCDRVVGTTGCGSVG